MVAAWVPLILLSSITVIVKVTEVCPAGIVTVTGTCSAVVSLEVIATATALAGAALTVSVPWTATMPSVVETGALTASVAVSLSCTAMIFESEPRLEVVALIAAVCVPSSTTLSRMVRSKVAPVCPTGIVTLAGTVTLEVLLEASDTTTEAACADSKVTLPWPASTPSPSVAALGMTRRREKVG